ncbi:hypothetical protein PYCCODRAFT_939343 [Trametes coccinea BRFM310]|uniref:DUF6534 domain-containing protein n=1 Tax=Trametes coccinea (strain BRFM310) TaxID=1353009 RepID=A0A1Y2IZK3_TRAC3|nr:hypothetical protein PYCCODRAFT_939343 [Trametes coccinea BRFM310]
MSFNQQPLDLTVGALLVGMTATSTLFGILTAQTVYYFRRYPEDRYFLKSLVTSVWALDAIQQVFFMATIWGWIIQRKADDIDGHPLMMSANVQLVVNAVLVCIVQLFYASRVYTLSRNSKLLISLCVQTILIFATLALSIVLCVKSITIHSLGDLYTVAGVGIALNSVSAATDLLLSGSLCYLLVRSRTGSAGTSRLINRLLLFCLNTGLLTTLCAITALAMLVSFPGSSLYVIFYFTGGRLYSISLIGTLNARADLRRRMNATGHLSHFTAPSRLSIRRPPDDTYANALRLDSPGPPVFRNAGSEDGSSGGYDDEPGTPRDGKGKAVSLPTFHWEYGEQQRV